MSSNAEELIPPDRSGGGVSPIRVAVVIAESRVSGLVRQLVESLDRLNGISCTIHFAIVVRSDVDTGPIAAELRSRGISFEVLREARALDFSIVSELELLFRAWGSDLIQTHGYKPNIIGLLIHRRLGLPWVAFYHGRTTSDIKVQLYHHINCHVMSRATAIVAVAHGVEGHLRKRDRSRLRVIENAVVDDQPTFRSREENRRHLGLQIHDRAVGFIGRLSPEKGPDLFVSSFSMLASQLNNVKGVIVGDGPLRKELNQLVSRLGLEDTVEFCGFVEEIGDIYSALDLVVISSRSEVFPNVLLEAVSAGVPVVATRVGGIPNIAEGLDSIRLADPENAGALASAMADALDSQSDSTIETTRSLLRERFSKERRASEFLDLYRGILRGC